MEGAGTNDIDLPDSGTYIQRHKHPFSRTFAPAFCSTSPAAGGGAFWVPPPAQIHLYANIHIWPEQKQQAPPQTRVPSPPDSPRDCFLHRHTHAQTYAAYIKIYPATPQKSLAAGRLFLPFPKGKDRKKTQPEATNRSYERCTGLSSPSTLHLLVRPLQYIKEVVRIRLHFHD